MYVHCKNSWRERGRVLRSFLERGNCDVTVHAEPVQVAFLSFFFYGASFFFFLPFGYRLCFVVNLLFWVRFIYVCSGSVRVCVWVRCWFSASFLSFWSAVFFCFLFLRARNSLRYRTHSCFLFWYVKSIINLLRGVNFLLKKTKKQINWFLVTNQPKMKRISGCSSCKVPDWNKQQTFPLHCEFSND